jgi:hypothetical protein
VEPSISAAASLLGKSRDQVVTYASPTVVTFDDIDGRTYGEAPGLGLSVIFEADRVSVVQLFGVGHDRYTRFQGSLPANLHFEMSRAEVRDALGSPAACADAHRVPHFGLAGAWDRFDLPGLSVHLEYAHGERAIRLTSLSAEPFQ